MRDVEGRQGAEDQKVGEEDEGTAAGTEAEESHQARSKQSHLRASADDLTRSPTCGSGARLARVACSQWFGSLTRHDHDLDLVQVEGSSSPVPSGSAPHVEHEHTRDAEEQK